MNTSTMRGVPVPTTRRRRSDSATEPIFTLVRPHAPQQEIAFESLDLEPDPGFEEEAYLPRPSWWRRSLAFLLFAVVLAGAVALLTRDEARQQILGWATFGHADTARHWIRSVQSEIDPRGSAK